MIVADTNNIIILFPQAIPNDNTLVIWDGTLLSNPYGCWDFVGWYGDNADQKGGELIGLRDQSLLLDYLVPY